MAQISVILNAGVKDTSAHKVVGSVLFFTGDLPVGAE